MKRRCGIFVIYNEHGLVELYVEILLRSLMEILDKLIIAVNGNILPEEKKKLYKYSENIFLRDNIGFDGGAYKDVFHMTVKSEDWRQWDEIVLLNDTFYGPFFHWPGVFKTMESSDCDFWGLTCHPGGREKLFDGKAVPPHVQSYFIVIRKRMVMSPDFLEFWEKMQYPSSFKEAVEKFEISFSEYFRNRGFYFDSWIRVQKEQFGYGKTNGRIDLEEFIIKFRFPVFKRKMYMLQNYISQKRIFEYLSNETDYPIKAITEDLYQRCKLKKVRPYNPEDIKKFCRKYEEIYLYGMGKYAKNLESFLNDNGIDVDGYILSEGRKETKRIFIFNEFEIKENTGIIVAMSEENFNGISEILRNKVPSEQMIVPLFD